MSQKLPVDGFKWIETSPIDKKFNKFIELIKIMIKKVMRDTYLK